MTLNRMLLEWQIHVNVSRPLKYDPKQYVVRMTKIPINVSRPLKYDSKQYVVRMTKYL